MGACTRELVNTPRAVNYAAQVTANGTQTRVALQAATMLQHGSFAQVVEHNIVEHMILLWVSAPEQGASRCTHTLSMSEAQTLSCLGIGPGSENLFTEV